MQKVLDTRKTFEVIWMTLINIVHYHITACLPLRGDGVLRTRQSICAVFEGNEISAQCMKPHGCLVQYKI